MDQIDRDSEFEAKILAAQIAKAAAVAPVAQVTGRCLNCNMRVRKHMRWCGPDCRDDWDALNKKQGDKS